MFHPGQIRRSFNVGGPSGASPFNIPQMFDFQRGSTGPQDESPRWVWVFGFFLGLVRALGLVHLDLFIDFRFCESLLYRVCYAGLMFYTLQAEKNAPKPRRGVKILEENGT